ncbi:MAG: CDP-alcohol phosphatidyltransferase [Elusimicrobia bacterium ADurb.Bin231]|nr:MAG: CDP-alcohol phosphatidyltransferase [Elusimicrobia bacterium ADurb.Bin231]
MKRGIYILPSIFTVGNMFFGFLSIISSFQEEFTISAWFIIISIAMDILDGRIARLTGTESAFGVELDSLSDFFSFGVAPSFLMYRLILDNMGKIGLAITFFFILACALRLARYNVLAHGSSEPLLHFEGLPAPAAGGLIAAFVLSYELFISGPELTAKTIPLLMKRMPLFFHFMPFLMILISICMVSKMRYSNFKKVNLKNPHSLSVLVLVVITILLIAVFPQNTIFLIFFFYLLSGVISFLIRMLNIRKKLPFRT